MRNRLLGRRNRRPGQQLVGRHISTLRDGLQVGYNLASVHDSGPYGLHLTNNSGVTFVSGKIRLSALFLSSWLSRSNHSALSLATAPWTVACWCYPDAIAVGSDYIWSKWITAGDDRGIVVRRAAATELIQVLYSPDGLGASAQTITSTGTMPADAWTHLIVDFDGDDYGLRFNGGAREETAGTGAPFDNAAPLEIGSLGGGSGWQGMLDSFFKWNRLLSPLEIARLQTLEFPL